MDGMTCGHCEPAVARAVVSVASGADVAIGRRAGRVTVTGAADEAATQRAIEAQGYTAVPVSS